LIQGRRTSSVNGNLAERPAMVQDVRDKRHISPSDLHELNFIKYPPFFIFRRHYRQGLRSHIMEVLHPRDVDREKNGTVSDGIKWYPRARPIHMLRIFRTKFNSFADALQEIERVKLIGVYLGRRYYANSIEFLVDYQLAQNADILLCGLQQYIEGVVIDPWGLINIERLAENLTRPGLGQPAPSENDLASLVVKIKQSATVFINNVKRMIHDVGFIPDLAGEGNLILTDDGHVKLVDINNISAIDFESDIPLDDKQYPVCDKSVEALALLEQKLACSVIDTSERLYRFFLDPSRQKTVAHLEKEFHLITNWQHARSDELGLG
jgi:hypothetical protein